MRLEQRACRLAAVAVLGAALTGCVPMVLVNYSVDAPGTQPSFSGGGSCSSESRRISAAGLEIPGAQVGFSAHETSKGLAVVVSIELADQAVASIKQTELQLHATSLDVPLLLSANEVRHYERKLRTICTRPKRTAPPKPFDLKDHFRGEPPVCKPGYDGTISVSQPIARDIVAADHGPNQLSSPVVYYVDYRFEGKVPEEFYIRTPVIEVNQRPLPPTTMRFRRNAELVVQLVNC